MHIFAGAGGGSGLSTHSVPQGTIGPSQPAKAWIGTNEVKSNKAIKNFLFINLIIMFSLKIINQSPTLNVGAPGRTRTLITDSEDQYFIH